MDNIYHKAIKAVGDGAKFKVNFASRSLKINGKYIIENGDYEGELGVSICTESEFLSNVEKLYHNYKHSVPSERSESKSRHYFRALPEREMKDEAMMFGERREKAQIELELYILCQIIDGFQWNAETMGRWFWQSKSDKDLVLLKSWVEPSK